MQPKKNVFETEIAIYTSGGEGQETQGPYSVIDRHQNSIVSGQITSVVQRIRNATSIVVPSMYPDLDWKAGSAGRVWRRPDV